MELGNRETTKKRMELGNMETAGNRGTTRTEELRDIGERQGNEKKKEKRKTQVPVELRTREITRNRGTTGHWGTGILKV